MISLVTSRASGAGVSVGTRSSGNNSSANASSSSSSDSVNNSSPDASSSDPNADLTGVDGATYGGVGASGSLLNPKM